MSESSLQVPVDMVGSLEGAVTVGPETAARLGVPVGTVVDLGVLAATDETLVGGGDALAAQLRGEAA